MTTLESLLETALRTPSPHNVQPWRVRILGEREGELYIDSLRTLPREDPTACFILSTMTMFLEALALLAGGRGLRLDWELARPPGWFAGAIAEARQPSLLPFARFRLVDDPTATSAVDPEIFHRRRTSRLALRPDPVPDEARAALEALAHGFGQRYVEVVERPAIERMLGWNLEALFEDLNSADYHDEIVSWFRFTQHSSRRHRDGLDFHCMNTSRSAFWLTARFPRLLLHPLTRPLLAWKYRRMTGAVPTIGMLAGPFWDAEAALAAGRCLLRFWLETARRGLYIHPFGNLVTNRRAAARVREATSLEDVWLVFKIGRSAEPPPSRRLPLEDILVRPPRAGGLSP